MSTTSKNSELIRLSFEDGIWITFAFLCFINIYGNYFEKAFLRSNYTPYRSRANKAYYTALIIVFFIYCYFIGRNYVQYQKASEAEKNKYLTKLFGSILLFLGVILLIKFQQEDNNFVGSPSL